MSHVFRAVSIKVSKQESGKWDRKKKKSVDRHKHRKRNLFIPILAPTFLPHF